MTSYERLMYVKNNGLMAADKILLITNAFLAAGKISQAEYDEITAAA